MFTFVDCMGIIIMFINKIFLPKSGKCFLFLSGNVSNTLLTMTEQFMKIAFISVGIELFKKCTVTFGVWGLLCKVMDSKKKKKTLHHPLYWRGMSPEDIHMLLPLKFALKQDILSYLGIQNHDVMIHHVLLEERFAHSLLFKSFATSVTIAQYIKNP